MSFTVNYEGDDHGLLIEVLNRVASYKGVVAITHNVERGGGPLGDTTTDFVVQEVGVSGSGAVRLQPWDEDTGEADREADPILLHVEDITEVTIY